MADEKTVRLSSKVHAWVQVQRHEGESFDDAVDRLLRYAIDTLEEIQLTEEAGTA